MNLIQAIAALHRGDKVFARSGQRVVMKANMKATRVLEWFREGEDPSTMPVHTWMVEEGAFSVHSDDIEELDGVIKVLADLRDRRKAGTVGRISIRYNGHCEYLPGRDGKVTTMGAIKSTSIDLQWV